jgi:hypothetical protein
MLAVANVENPNVIRMYVVVEILSTLWSSSRLAG